MFVEGVGPAETVLVGLVRELVGPDVPIACTFDLHGNIPSRLGDFGDILVGLKTAPHTDSAETAELAGLILADTMKGRIKPVSYVLPVPIIVQGEMAMTTAEPFGSLEPGIQPGGPGLDHAAGCGGDARPETSGSTGE